MPGGRGLIHVDEDAPLGARQRRFQLQGLIALDLFPERTIDGVGHVGFPVFEHGQWRRGVRHALEHQPVDRWHLAPPPASLRLPCRPPVGASQPPARASCAPGTGGPLTAARSFSSSADTRCLRSRIILSNVGGAQNPATPATARSVFSDIRLLRPTVHYCYLAPRATVPCVPMAHPRERLRLCRASAPHGHGERRHGREGRVIQTRERLLDGLRGGGPRAGERRLDLRDRQAQMDGQG
jgi:hypothetical protein